MRVHGIPEQAVRIYIVAEHYPSLYKPYFDTQFEQLIRDGHSVSVFALGAGDRSLRPPDGIRGRLHRETRYLPVGKGSLPAFFDQIAANLSAAPAARFAALRRARQAQPPRVNTLTDSARLFCLPLDPPDLCLVHNLIAALRVRFLRDLYPGVPVAFYYHGGELPDVPAVLDHEAPGAFAAADLVFTNTQRSKAHAVSRGCDPGRIVVNPVGFDLGEFPLTAERAYRRGGRLNLLSIGRLSPEKGFGYALEAARQLVQQGFTAFHYRIPGGGPLAAALRRQAAASGLDGFVDFLGPISREALLREMCEADVLVLPSIVVGTWEENQACVVQEAMLSRALVIATETGGVPESLAPALHRFMVPEGDASAIADRVREVASLPDSELSALADAGRRFAEHRYDIRMLNQRLIDETIARTQPQRSHPLVPA